MPTPAGAFSEVQDYFLGSGVATLGRGGVAALQGEPEAVSLDRPYSLMIAAKNQYARLDTSYEHQRILHIYHGNWQGTHAESDSLETSLASPYTLLGGDLQLVVAAGYENQGHDVMAISRDNNTAIQSDQSFDSGRAALLASYRQKISGALTLDANGYAKALEIPFEVRLTPWESVSFGYQRDYHHINDTLALTSSGISGTIPVSYRYNHREIYLESRLLSGRCYLRFGIDPVDRYNLSGEAKVSLSDGLYLVGAASQWEVAGFQQSLTLAGGVPGGNLDAQLKSRRYRIGVGWDISKRWTVEANYLLSLLELDGGGIANTRAVVGFWPSLVVGDYNFLYSGGLRLYQVHLGTEYKGERFSFQSGVQYLHLDPTFNLDYWRSVLFGIGRTGEGNVNLTTDRIDMIGLFLGFGYHLGPVRFSYGVGQFIPVATHDKTSSSQTAGSSGGGRDLFEQIGDKLSHHPGGLTQRLQLTVAY